MALPAHATTGERIWYYTFRVLVAVVFIYLVFPILTIIPLSFNSGEFLHYPLQGVSLRWYHDVIASGQWAVAVKNSLIVGISSMILATVLGTTAAVGLNRVNFPGKQLLVALLISPMMIPLVISALALYLFFAKIGFNDTYLGIILAHTILGMPFVLITVSATLQGFDYSLVNAGASLGAAPLPVFFRIVMPLILPGIVSGAMFAFATSLDEVVVVLFIAGPAHRTLPLQMFSGIREHLSPTILAVATMLIGFAGLLMLTLEFLRKRNEKLNAPANIAA
ncbi:MAG: ABC transporter permease [Desulfobulbus sp.]|nr:MAG: ABC transporter permease [Desulfobulbus sp.]